MTRRRARCAALGLALLCFGPASATTLQPSERESLERRAARARVILDEDRGARQTWQKEYRELLLARAGAEARTARARFQTRSERKRHRYRGANRINAQARAAAAREELHRIDAAIAAFRERARRGGAQPGWLSAVEEEVPGNRRPTASR